MEITKFSEMAKEFISKKINVASECMKRSPKCEEIYNVMCAKGYEKEMQAFKNMIFLSYCIHPERSEEDILVELMSKMHHMA